MNEKHIQHEHGIFLNVSKVRYCVYDIKRMRQGVRKGEVHPVLLMQRRLARNY